MAEKNLPSTLVEGSISKPSISKMRKMLDDRIDQTEAIKLATMIVTSYPNTDGKVSETYLGAIASILQDYPASIARQCATKGIVLTCKFLPTVADIVLYCDRFSAPLYKQTEYLMRVEKQFKEREEFVERQKKRLSIQELKEKYGDWQNNWQPIPGAEDKYKPPKVDPTKPKPGSYFDMVAKHGRPIGPFEQLGDKWNPVGKAKPAMPESQSGQTMSDAELRAYYGQREAEFSKQYNNDPFAGLE